MAGNDDQKRQNHGASPGSGGGKEGGGRESGGRDGGGRSPRGGPGRHGVRIESAKNPKRAARRLMRYFGSEKALFFVATLLIVANVVLRSLSPALIGQAIKNYLEVRQDLAGFTERLWVIFSIALGSWFAGASSGMIITRIANKLVFKLRGEAFTHIQSLSMAYFDRQGIGDLISRLTNDMDTIYNALHNGFTNLASGLLSIIGIIIAMFVLNVSLTLVVLAMVPILLFVTAVIGKRVRAAFRENQKYVGMLTGRIQESVSGVRVIKTFFREAAEFRSFDTLNATARDVGVKAEFTAYIFNPVINFVTAVALALMVGIGGALVVTQAGVFSVGLLTAFILYARRFFQPLRQATGVYNLLQSALAGAERIFTILDTTPDVETKENPYVPTEAHGEIEFRNVSFAYEPGKPVLNDVGFSVRQGQTVAIVGPTGAGKTTMVNLLSRYYDVNEGSILVDGTDVRDYDPGALRSMMGVVLQEPFFFARSIRENLTYGNPRVDEAAVTRAATLANADAFIRRLPQGYETKLSERGMNISQGERQLLAIARAILANPSILILDEATSNVDSLTEASIQKGLLELMKGRTSLIIAHRLSTIKNADNLIVVHDRHVIEQGTHRQLMEKGGFYSRLYSVQLTRAEVTEDMQI